MDTKPTFEMEEYLSLAEMREIFEEEINNSYPEEMLIACLNGKPCSYGICDECPITNGYYRSDDDDNWQEEQKTKNNK